MSMLLCFSPKRPTLLTASSLRVFDQIKTIEKKKTKQAEHRTATGFPFPSIVESKPFQLCSQKQKKKSTFNRHCWLFQKKKKSQWSSFKKRHSMGRSDRVWKGSGDSNQSVQNFHLLGEKIRTPHGSRLS